MSSLPGRTVVSTWMGILPGSPGVNRNLVFDNEFHCGPHSSYFDYCRPFGIDGIQAGSAEYNVVFNNRMHDFSVAAQVNGNNNYLVGNTCYNTSNSKTRRLPTGQCFSLQPYQWSRDNLVANNTMAYTADVAIQLIPGRGGVSAGHRIVNNIMYGCGLDTRPTRRDACIALARDDSVGPQVLINNLMYNPGRSVEGAVSARLVGRSWQVAQCLRRYRRWQPGCRSDVS